jgi:hypothetical protein
MPQTLKGRMNRYTNEFILKRAAQISVLVFWIMTPSVLVGRYPRFAQTYCPSLEGFRWDVQKLMLEKALVILLQFSKLSTSETSN